MQNEPGVLLIWSCGMGETGSSGQAEGRMLDGQTGLDGQCYEQASLGRRRWSQGHAGHEAVVSTQGYTEGSGDRQDWVYLNQ